MEDDRPAIPARGTEWTRGSRWKGSGWGGLIWLDGRARRAIGMEGDLVGGISVVVDGSGGVGIWRVELGVSWRQRELVEWVFEHLLRCVMCRY